MLFISKMFWKLHGDEYKKDISIQNNTIDIVSDWG